MKGLWTIVAVLAVLLPGSVLLGGDVLRIENGGTREKAALVDGALDGVHVNDASYREIAAGSLLGALFPVIPLANFTASEYDEIVAFAGGRPPVLRSAAWTNGNNTIPVEFEDEYRIAVSVWIVKGPFEDQRNRAAAAAVTTSRIWSTERMGLAFSAFDIFDVTHDPDADQYHNFTCSKAADFRDDIGFVAGMINVYWVDTVDFGSGPSTGNGVWCGESWAGGTMIGMGRYTGGGLLTHELGHAFYLGHVNFMIAAFDKTNVMHSSSNQRNYLSEGQVFRAVFTPGSDLNDFYTIRAGQPTRSGCPHNLDTELNECPALQKRIWSDGNWPPN